MQVMGRIVSIFGVLVVVMGAFPLSSLSEDGKVLQPRFASLQSVKTERGPVDRYDDVAQLPAWLDALLRRVPDPGDTSALEEELQEGLSDKKPDREKDVETKMPQDEDYIPTPADGESDPFSDDPYPVKLDTPTEKEKKPAGLKPIPPLYSSPVLDGEGIWRAEELPSDRKGNPLVYRTVYRPSVEYPNAIVYMAAFDMQRVKARLFIGHTEPGIYEVSRRSGGEDLSKIVAITNAMWMQRHARGAGAIFRGREVYPMVAGMATLIIYRDDSVDIREWSDDIPRRLVKDARQLRHLIVKNGLVVEKVAKYNKIVDAEIGLGGFLVDKRGRSTMRKKEWFLADRSAFGIRDDGFLVFAMAHHCGTKDLAKALVLAGCKRAIHGDANIHNVVCNFYFRDDRDKIVKRDKLSPEQKKYTMRRYDRGYSKDFFAFYEKGSGHTTVRNKSYLLDRRSRRSDYARGSSLRR